MAKGDVHFFAAFQQKCKAGVAFNLTSDTLRIGIVNNATVPAIGTNDPRWGTGGSTDFSASQVPTGTGYTGPIALTGVGYTRSGAVNSVAAANVSIPQDASGFTTGYWGIIYDDTVAGKYAIGYVELGGPQGNVNGPLNINWGSGVIFTETTN